MKKYILAFVIIVLYFGGLNSVRELTDLAIVKAVSIDKTDDGKYEICAIVIDTTDYPNNSKIYFLPYQQVKKFIKQGIKKQKQNNGRCIHKHNSSGFTFFTNKQIHHRKHKHILSYLITECTEEPSSYTRIYI